MGWLKRQADARHELETTLRRWAEAEVKDVDADLLEIASNAVDRELESRNALNTRLTATITFAGALLAAALTLGRSAGSVDLPCVAYIAFAISFVGAVLLLVASIALSISAIQPEPRNRANPKLLRHYATEGSPTGEVRADTYKLEVSLLEQLGPGNTLRAHRLRLAQRLLAGALTFAAAGSLILFFSS